MNIAALLSGGVDSSVAVHLLCEQGYRPDLYYIKIGMQEKGYLDCSQEEDLEIVTAMAHRYGLKYEVVDLQKEYWDNVVAYTIDKVKRGLTPNPDVMCNKLIKFGCFEEKVGHSYDKTATGHYATTIEENGKVWLGTTPDPVKDQTDFLAQIDYLQVSRLMFPIGGYMKQEVRHIAESAKLPSANRKDSQGICFLGKIDYNQFIEKYLGRREGNIIEMETGKILGRHQGFWFHTIGQRKGLGLSGGPWFVCRKDVDDNVVYVSKGYNPEGQQADELRMHGFHFITCNPWEEKDAAGIVTDRSTEGVEVLFKIRHVPELTRGRLVRETAGGDGWHLYSEEKINGVAPGQFCVIYSVDGRICYGSGEIAWG